MDLASRQIHLKSVVAAANERGIFGVGENICAKAQKNFGQNLAGDLDAKTGRTGNLYTQHI
jgi:hypothetical protein